MGHCYPRRRGPKAQGTELAYRGHLALSGQMRAQISTCQRPLQSWSRPRLSPCLTAGSSWPSAFPTSCLQPTDICSCWLVVHSFAFLDVSWDRYHLVVPQALKSGSSARNLSGPHPEPQFPPLQEVGHAHITEVCAWMQVCKPLTSGASFMHSTHLSNLLLDLLHSSPGFFSRLLAPLDIMVSSGLRAGFAGPSSSCR